MFRVVGFEIETKNIASNSYKVNDDLTCKNAASNEIQEIKPDSENVFTMSYEITWASSDIPWASRWDSYLKMSDVKIHWFSIVNSLVVIFFLAGILSMILVRSLRRDIAKYNREDEPVRLTSQQKN